jgi:hypothetical protein
MWPLAFLPAGCLAALAIYWLDIRKLYHQEEEIKPLLLGWLDALLVRLGLGTRDAREIIGIVLTYLIYAAIWLSQSRHPSPLTWAWATAVAVIAALDLRTAYVPALPLLYLTSLALIVLHGVAEGFAPAMGRLAIGASFYGLSTALALGRRQDEQETGGGDPPVLLLIGTGYNDPALALRFLLIAGALCFVYGVVHICATLFARRTELMARLGGAIYTLPSLIQEASGKYVTPIPFLPPICLAALCAPWI